MTGIYSSFSLQHVKTISAHTFSELKSAPLIIGFQVDETLDGGWAEITVHTDNTELTAALVSAINSAVASIKEKQSSPEVEAA